MSMPVSRRERLGAVAPALGLALVLGAPPTLLTLLAGWPLPTTAAVKEAFQLGWVSPDLALHLAATVAWLCWLYLLANVVIVAVAQVRRHAARVLLPQVLARIVNAGVAACIAWTGIATRQAALPANVLVVAEGAPLGTPQPTQATATHRVHIVKPRDTLWDIAEDQLGDPLRWREIWRLNAQQLMADGHRFSQPDLIRPGWRLELPTLTEPAARVVLKRPRPTPPASSVVATTPQPTSSGPAIESPAPAPAMPTTKRPDVTHEKSPYSFPLGLGLGAAAVGIVTLLDRQRRRAMRRRPVGRRIPLPTGELAAAEKALRSPSVTEAAHFVAGAVRLSSMITGGTGERVLLAAFDGPDGVELRFSGDPLALPAPFRETAHGWLLPRIEQSAVYAAADRADPAPALVQVGVVDGTKTYVNLEAFGALCVDGEAQDVVDLLTRAVMELGGSPWSDLVEVRIATDVAGCEDLTGHSARVQLGEEFQRLSALSEQTARAVHAAGAKSLAGLRLRTAEPPDGVSLVIASPTSTGLAGVLELAKNPLTPVVMLVTGRCDGIETLRLVEGTVEIPGLDESITVDRVPEKSVEAVQSLLEQASSEHVPALESPYDRVRAEAPPTISSAELEVAVLGPVEINGPQAPLAPRVRDILVYLALHRRGVEPDTFGGAIWPESRPTSQTLRNRIHETRRAIGGHITEGPCWRLDDTVSTDWARFQALAAGDLDDKKLGLSLVRGRPLQGFDSGWVSLEGFVYEIEARIVDVALEVAQAMLDVGEPAAATTAARAGLRAAPWDERLYRIAMRAAAAKGSPEELKRLRAELRVALDLDVEDETDEETDELFIALEEEAQRRARLGHQVSDRSNA